MEKNEIIQLHIEDLTDDGNGIGHANGMAVFVKDTVPGDEAEVKIIKVKKRYAFGRLMNLIKESSQNGTSLHDGSSLWWLYHHADELSKPAGV